MRYSFSGHESFYCKPLWLKKGYDFIKEDKSFNDISSVVDLGVGKNMVSSIRYWMKSFGLTTDDHLCELANYIFEDTYGKDPYCEDMGTLWILHFMLVYTNIASIYNLCFVDFQRERKDFDRDQILGFIKRKCSTSAQKSVYNENTVKKDITVLLHTYVAPLNLKQLEHFNALLIELGLIYNTDDDKYRFRETNKCSIPDQIFMFALYTLANQETTLSFDMIQYLSLIFCLPTSTTLEMLSELSIKYKDLIAYTDNSGVRNVHILKQINKYTLLDSYYNDL